MIKMIDRLGHEDQVERQLAKLCPYLHYDALDACHEMTVCGAYLDRMVLGGQRLQKVLRNGKSPELSIFPESEIQIMIGRIENRKNGFLSQ